MAIAKCLACHAEAIFRGTESRTDDLRYAMKLLQPAKKLNAVLQELEQAQYICTHMELLSGARAAQIIELNPHAPDFTVG